MSRNERKRMTIMAGVKRQELTQVQAAELLNLGYRQTKRVWRRYQDQGDAGLVHRLRGHAGLRRKPAAVRTQVLALYAEERYADFGPTLLAEELGKAGIVVDHDTVRRWLLAAGKLTVRRRKQVHRQWRERKPCFGAMVQLDGSHHDWFEGRRAKCVLMVMVDDATNRMRARFSEAETTHASYDVFEGWVHQHGQPGSVYVDRDSLYRCEGKPGIAEQLAGKERLTQFGRAMAQLGVALILANSPQAKGRVERMNGVLQDRLVKALRLAGIQDLAAANEFLVKTYLPEHQRQFRYEAASAVDAHQAVPQKLDEVLSWEVERVVQRDWTVASGGKRYQLDPQHEALSLAGKPVIVRTLRDGGVQLERRGVKLRWKAISGRPVRAPARPEVKAKRAEPGRKPAAAKKPGAGHPWRRQRIGSVRKWAQRRRGACLAVGDSGRPALRSGFPAAPTARHGAKKKTTSPGDIFV